jgi:hypothetical protein
MSSNVTVCSSYSTNAEREASDTDADFTPSKEFNFFSTCAEHAEHAMPTTGIVFFNFLNRNYFRFRELSLRSKSLKGVIASLKELKGSSSQAKRASSYLAPMGLGR